MKTNGWYAVFSIPALVLIFTALFSEVAILWLVSLPFSVGAALVMKNQDNGLMTFIWSITVVFGLLNFLTRL